MLQQTATIIQRIRNNDRVVRYYWPIDEGGWCAMAKTGKRCYLLDTQFTADDWEITSDGFNARHDVYFITVPDTLIVLKGFPLCVI